MCCQKTESHCTKFANNKHVVAALTKFKNLIEKTGTAVSKQGALPQLAIGTVSGWCTGFLTTKIGKKAAFAVGGGIILASAANVAGLVKIDFEKFGTKFESQTCETFKQNCPKLKTHMVKYGRGNTMLMVGFIGGFLLGFAT